MKEMLTCSALFLRGHSEAENLIFSFKYPWEALPHIEDFILKYGKALSSDEYYSPFFGVWVSKRAKISKTAKINGPCIIGENTEIREGAFIRGNAFIGAGCVIGNSVELKNCIISNECQIPHFNYVGDSILGYRVHMGAGSVTSNVKSDKSFVTVKIGDERIETDLRKFGAMLGDFVEIGCNSVLNPGCVVGANSTIYPLSSVRGFVPQNSIFKSAENIVVKE